MPNISFKAGKSFIEAMDRVVRTAVPDRATSNYLLFVKVSAAKNGSVWISGTNLEVAVRVRCLAEVKTPGECLMLGHVINNLLGKISSDTVTITDSGTGHASVRAGRSSYRVATLDPAEFPSFPLWSNGGSRPVTVSERGLKAAIDHAMVSTVQAPSRDCFMGSQIAFGDKKIRITSSTGSFHSMATVGAQIGKTKGAVVVKNGVLKRVASWLLVDRDGDIEISINDRHLAMRNSAKDMECVMVRLETPFVPIERMVPNGKKLSVDALVPVKDLRPALGRVSIIATDGMGSDLVTCNFSGRRLTIVAESASAGKGEEKIPCKLRSGGGRISVNVRDLHASLNSLAGDHLAIRVAGDNQPCLVSSDGLSPWGGVGVYMLSVYSVGGSGG